MALRLKLCGKMTLRCGHPCLEEAGSNHTCTCFRKWSFDPGCHHFITGNCNDYVNLRLVCLAICGKILDCGHPCAELCTNKKCFCHACFDKHSTEDPKELLEKITKQLEKLKIGSRKPVLEPHAWKMEGASGPSAAGCPGSSKTKFNEWRYFNQKPRSSKMSTGPDATSNAGASGSNTWFRNAPSDRTPEGMLTLTELVKVSDLKLRSHQVDQLNRLMLEPVKPGAPKIRVFKQCVHEHVFTDELEYCNVCGYPPEGPTITVYDRTDEGPDMDDTAPLGSGPDIYLNDDNAWRFGMTKCQSGHFFKAELRRCNYCGMTSAFQFPGVFFNDSESD